MAEGDSVESPSARPSSRQVIAEEGGIGSRLKMWEQSIRIAISNPLGTGAGSFRDTIHAFQRYPLIGFSSAHNVFVETLATGGWLRLFILVLLVALCLLKGWRSQRWPLALGAAALWGSMSFDITGQMPAIASLGFFGLGACIGKPNASAPERLRRLSSGLVLVVALAFALWWYLPCSDIDCIEGRHLGYRPEVNRLIAADTADPQRLAEQAIRFNPHSLWAWRLWADQHDDQLGARRELVQRFPLASPEQYVRWAEAALAAGAEAEAREAILEGLEVFPADLQPAGVPLGGRAAAYQRWLASAEEILRLTQ